MVRRGLARSRSEAQALIQGGKVTADGVVAPRAAFKVALETAIVVDPEHRRWVSRGAEKLHAALESFEIDVSGRRALDVGASTGGFTEVLLDAGATSVVALDVGTGQLNEQLRSSPRVTSLEGTNFRDIDVASIGAPFDVVVVDLSFISLCVVAEALANSAGENSDIVVLVKPQFEVGRDLIGKSGVVRAGAARESAVQAVVQCLSESGLEARGLIESPILGARGNLEYLLWVRKNEPAIAPEVEL